jgi:mono/diheme cytochrome c family protein
MKKIFFFFTFLFLISSCANDSENDLINVPDTVTYNNSVKAIIDANCIGCHGNTNPLANLSLTNFSQVQEEVDNIIERIELPQGTTGLMPQSGTRLPQNSIDIIKKWRDDGLNE